MVTDYQPPMPELVPRPGGQARHLPPGFLDLLGLLMRNPSVVGSEHSFFWVLQRELEERGRSAWISPSYRALVHTALGEHVRALDLLEEATEKRAADLLWLAVRPAWAPLNGEPRFHAILRLLHIPETSR